jgi:hypothetical protein
MSGHDILGIITLVVIIALIVLWTEKDANE